MEPGTFFFLTFTVKKCKTGYFSHITGKPDMESRVVKHLTGSDYLVKTEDNPIGYGIERWGSLNGAASAWHPIHTEVIFDLGDGDITVGIEIPDH